MCIKPYFEHRSTSFSIGAAVRTVRYPWSLGKGLEICISIFWKEFAIGIKCESD